MYVLIFAGVISLIMFLLMVFGQQYDQFGQPVKSRYSVLGVTVLFLYSIVTFIMVSIGTKVLVKVFGWIVGW